MADRHILGIARVGRIILFMSLPIAKLDWLVLKHKLDEIGRTVSEVKL